MSGRHLIVGTAGHIDHGKSSLVRALTGIDPDRLKQEKERGITIELGFADLTLDGERTVSFVDVPGHERFVRHMVAGAAGVDAVLLVVAADDGVRPQTREHLQICSLLGVEHGVVALTKCDLLDEELRQVVELEIREFLGESFLADAPLVSVSSTTGAGLDLLRAELERLHTSVAERPVTGIARLPVDRSFSLRGFGTVVTGTLVSGEIEVGQELEVLPGGHRARIRGLQVHRTKVERAHAGQRAAVNLQGLDRAGVPRGSTLAAVDALLTTRRILARVSLLPGAPDSLKRGGAVRFHQGTCERAARMRVLDIRTDGTLVVELRLDEETLLLPGDRFILRRPAPVDTIGGGTIRDTRPPRRFDSAAEDYGSDPAEQLAPRLIRAGLAGCAPAELAAELGWSGAELADRLDSLVREGAAWRAAGRVFDGPLWSETAEAAQETLAAYHGREPLRPGMPREELRGQLCRDLPLEAWREMLENLARKGRIRLAGERVALSSHRVVLSESERELSSGIESRFRAAGLEPPSLDEVLATGDRARAERLLDLLIAEGSLVRIRDGRLFHRDALVALRERLCEYAKNQRTIDVATFKQLTGVTRRNAIPLLEQLDAERITRRVGNIREILGAGGGS